MKQIIFFIIIIGIASKSFGQSEFSTKFKAIPPLNNKPKLYKKEVPPVVTPPITPPNVFKSPDLLNPKSQLLPNNSYQLGNTNEISMIPKNNFINPGDVIKDKMNKKQDDPYAVFYRKNQNLGDFKTKSLTAKVMYRDAEYVDGDIIRVYLNDRVIQNEVILDSSFKGFEIVLEKGFNKIEFEALNQGSSGPNTAEFQVYDDKGGLISASQWNLGTGFRATMVITKD